MLEILISVSNDLSKVDVKFNFTKDCSSQHFHVGVANVASNLDPQKMVTSWFCVPAACELWI